VIFVKKKFASESTSEEEISNVKISKRELDGFRKFEEFLEEIKERVKRDIHRGFRSFSTYTNTSEKL